MTNEISKGVKEEIKRMINWMSEQVLDDQQAEGLVKAILNTQDEKGNNIKRIFVAGLGRSGFVAEAFGMRLAHLGYDVHILGEPTAPAVGKEDLFIVVSGSGASLIQQIMIAREIGAEIIMITSLTGSVGAKLADVVLIIPGREKEEYATLSYEERQMRGLPVFPLGTAFEGFAMTALDAIISYLVLVKKKTEEDLKSRHANIQKR